MIPQDPRFSAFATTHRSRLVGTAVLLGEDGVEAERVTHAALARLSERWADVDDPLVTAYAAVLGTHGPRARLPWERSERIDLVDRETRPTVSGDVLVDLDRLDLEARRTVVLRDVAGLTAVEIAAVLDRDVTTIEEAFARGRAALAELGSVWPDTAAVLEPLGAGADPGRQVGDDLAAGRRLRRRRRSRRVAAAAAVALVAALGLSQLLPRVLPASTGPAVVPTAAPTSCDTAQERCRAELVTAWREEMADVVASHLDPEGRYFDSVSYAYVSDRTTADLWAGRGGALSVDLFRRDRGATQVRLEIASSRDTALRCGASTKRQCFSMRFMDGNRFTLTDSVDVEDGIEVQHRPAATYVLTAVARNVGNGPGLPIGTGDLVKLLQDPRLVPPVG